MFIGVSSNKKLLLASATIIVIGVLLPWVKGSLRGFQLKYGLMLLFLLIITLMIAHISRNILASILILIISSLSFIIVLQSYIELFVLNQFPSSYFRPGIGAFVIGIGTIGMIYSGISGIIINRNNRS